MEETIKILVVDDEKVIRDGCHRVLNGKGYQVLTAENGKIALDILIKDHIDIILLDLKMPVMSGEEVLERTSSQYPEIPVIIITGHGTIDTAVECMKKGAYDFITKPFQFDPFLLTINRAAEKRKLEQKAKNLQDENVKNLYDLYLEKSRLRTIINCMANGVMVNNRNMEVVLHNPALMKLLEISEQKENPLPLNKIIRNESLVSTLDKIQSGKTSEGEFISQEIKAMKKTLRAISAPALGPDNQVVGTVTVLEDITPFKQLDEMKSDFVNMVAHELRSPLAAIRQQNSVILEGLAGPLQEKQKALLDRVIQKIDTLLDLINDLLDIATIEAGKTVQRQIPLDVSQIMENMVALMSAKAQEKDIQLACSCQNMKTIFADPKGIEEVFSNLITNAINYSPSHGKVEVTAEGLNEYMEIKVMDTGFGIPPDELPKIFDKFYRVKHPQTRQVMGTGLGLAIVKGIVEAHNGTIEVESTPDQGTTFKILLPIIK
ncbi:MAG: response regulator [Deltaproteobacteria bacterium]|nr:response regulator [Deltaproteobacteria bacterium]